MVTHIANKQNLISRALDRPWLWMVALPTLLLAVITLGIRQFEIDMLVSQALYTETHEDLNLGDLGPWWAIYLLGTLFSMTLGFGGLVVWLYYKFTRQRSIVAHVGVFFFLGLLVGPGLIVNAILKPIVTRPRPHHVVEFGGDHEFVPVGNLGFSNYSKSFPCGHATLGFFLMIPGFLFLHRSQAIALSFIGFGLVFGGVIGLGRIVEGAHFVSDVVWSGGFVYLSCVAIYFLTGLKARLHGEGIWTNVEDSQHRDEIYRFDDHRDSLAAPSDTRRERRKKAAA